MIENIGRIISMQTLETRIINFTVSPRRDLYADSIIHFEGLLEYYNTDQQQWYAVGLAPIKVRIKDRLGTILGEVTGTTSNEFFTYGDFSTTNFYIPRTMANSDIIIDVIYEGSETFKPAYYYTLYHIGGICQIKSSTGECEPQTIYANNTNIAALGISAGIIIGLLIGSLATEYRLKKLKQ